MMKKFIGIIKEEFYNFFHDSGAMLIMIIGVVVYSLFYAIPYSTEIIKDAPVGVVDLDHSNLSREFTKNLNATDYTDVVSSFNDMKDAQNQFYEDKIKGFVLIPKNFEKDILRGTQSTVSVYADTSYLIIYKAIYTGVVQTAVSLGAKIEVGKLLKAGVPKQMAMALKQPFEFVQVPMYNPAGGYETYVYPVILILILHQTLVVGMGLMQGTKNELKEDYCKKEEDLPLVVFGRCTTYVLLYLFYSIIIFLFYPAIFVYPMSYNIFPLFLMLVLMYYSAGFFSNTISYFFKTRESALLILVVTSLIFIFVPGLIWPRESIPQFINVLALFIPATCSVDGIIKINQMNATLWDIRYDLFWVFFLCLMYFKLACVMIKKSSKNNKG